MGSVELKKRQKLAMTLSKNMKLAKRVPEALDTWFSSLHFAQGEAAAINSMGLPAEVDFWRTNKCSNN